MSHKIAHPKPFKIIPYQIYPIHQWNKRVPYFTAYKALQLIRRNAGFWPSKKVKTTHSAHQRIGRRTVKCRSGSNRKAAILLLHVCRVSHFLCYYINESNISSLKRLLKDWRWVNVHYFIIFRANLFQIVTKCVRNECDSATQERKTEKRRILQIRRSAVFEASKWKKVAPYRP